MFDLSDNWVFLFDIKCEASNFLFLDQVIRLNLFVNLLLELQPEICFNSLQIWCVLDSFGQVDIFFTQLLNATFEQCNFLLTLGHFYLKVLDSFIVLILELQPALTAMQTCQVLRTVFFGLSGVAWVEAGCNSHGLGCWLASCSGILRVFVTDHRRKYYLAR